MRNFTQGSLLKHMLIFTAPLMLTNTVQAMYATIDAMWVGKLLGASALAAVSTIMPVIFMSAALIIGLSVAATIIAGQAYGAGNLELLAKTIISSFMANIILCSIVSVLGVIFARTLLMLINVPLSIIDNSTIFMRIIFSGLIFNFITQWYAGILNGVGNSRTPAIILIISVIINACLAPVLIRGIWFIPQLGIAGSALSTIISSFVAVILCGLHFKRTMLHINKRSDYKFDKVLMKRILLLGLPIAAQMLLVSISFVLVISLVNRFGEKVTAVFGIGSRIDQFAFSIIMAVSSAVSVMSAQNIGAQFPHRARQTAYLGVALSLAVAFLFMNIVLFMPDRLTSIFVSDHSIMDMTRRYFHYTAWSYIGIAILFSFQGAVRGAGDAVSALVIVAISMIVFRIPLCYYLAEHTSLREEGLWLGILISVFIGAINFTLYFGSNRWQRKIRVTPQKIPEAEL